MAFFPIIIPPHRGSSASGYDDVKNNLLLTSNNKRMVVYGMDFVVRTCTVDASKLRYGSNLTEEIKKLADEREVVDYQILPYRIDGSRMDEYMLVLTCKKTWYD